MFEFLSDGFRFEFEIRLVIDKSHTDSGRENHRKNRQCEHATRKKIAPSQAGVLSRKITPVPGIQAVYITNLSTGVIPFQTENPAFASRKTVNLGRLCCRPGIFRTRGRKPRLRSLPKSARLFRIRLRFGLRPIMKGRLFWMPAYKSCQYVSSAVLLNLD